MGKVEPARTEPASCLSENFPEGWTIDAIQIGYEMAEGAADAAAYNFADAISALFPAAKALLKEHRPLVTLILLIYMFLVAFVVADVRSERSMTYRPRPRSTPPTATV